jgi:AAA domain-containing protein/primase-like protein
MDTTGTELDADDARLDDYGRTMDRARQVMRDRKAPVDLRAKLGPQLAELESALGRGDADAAAEPAKQVSELLKQISSQNPAPIGRAAPADSPVNVDAHLSVVGSTPSSSPEKRATPDLREAPANSHAIAPSPVVEYAPPTRFGATVEEWTHFANRLELTADLLPVVSNPNAKISPYSKIKQLGKTPSRYDAGREFVGIKGWTARISTADDVRKWSGELDYGICIQTRSVRAFDVDVTDPVLARKIRCYIEEFFGEELPCRVGNSPKFLLAVKLAGERSKRDIKTAAGKIEFLGNGQQFVAAGTHPSGPRYEWEGGLPAEIPEISPEQLEALWSELQEQFGIEEAPKQREHDANYGNDDLARAASIAEADDQTMADLESALDYLAKNTDRASEHNHNSWVDDGMALASLKGTKCEAEVNRLWHQYSATNDAQYTHEETQAKWESFEPSAITYKSIFKLAQAAGWKNPRSAAAQNKLLQAAVATATGRRFQGFPAARFAQCAFSDWTVKGVIPRAELIIVIGESGSGKTFLVFDLAAHVAQGFPWRGRRVKKMRVVYIVAEGAAGFRNRLLAWCIHHSTPIEQLDVIVIPAAPNLLQKDDVKAVIEEIKHHAPVGLIVVDTFAQTMAGGNENSGEDVGRALGHCKAIHQATGASVLLVHHLGKNEALGARGWSGLKAAADAEITITNKNGERVATVSKSKDGQQGLDFVFRLRTVNLGLDEDGEVISSCVVDHINVPAARPKAEPRGSVEGIVLQALEGLVGPGNASVNTQTLIEKAMQHLSAPVEGKEDRRSYRVHRALESLQAKRFVSTVNNITSLAEDGL